VIERADETSAWSSKREPARAAGGCSVDARLPGPIPFVFERVYESCSSARRTALGYGWNHSYDESLWMERGRAVVRLGDNREVEFPLWDLPDRRMRVGDTLERVIHKMRLTCTGPGSRHRDHPDRRIVISRIAAS
jgi:hypothetical protein